MMLCDVLEIPKGVSAVIGSGGKTSLILRLAQELQSRGKVVICTTTKMWRPAENEVLCRTKEEAVEALKVANIVYIGEINQQNKLIPPVFDGWWALADYVLVEADGSAGLPLKAHAPWEPVLPPACRKTVCVVGASGIGKPIEAAAHRPDRFAALCGKKMTDRVEERDIAAVLSAEKYHDCVFINQTDAAAADELASLLTCPVVTGSLQNKTWKRLK